MALSRIRHRKIHTHKPVTVTSNLRIRPGAAKSSTHPRGPLGPLFNQLQPGFLLAHYKVNKTSKLFHQTSRSYASSTAGFGLGSKDTESKPTSLLRSGLRPLFLKVHPDFFTHTPEIQVQNDRSLKQLNALLDLLDEYSTLVGDHRGHIILDKHKVPNRVAITFYVKRIKVENKLFLQESKMCGLCPLTLKSPLSLTPIPIHREVDYDTIASAYTFPVNFFQTPFPKKLLEREILHFINDILRQANIAALPIPGSDKKDENEETEYEDDIDVRARKRSPKEVHRDQDYAQFLNRSVHRPSWAIG